MPAHSPIVQNMILRIADFFRYMSDNGERRLYYVVPVQQPFPYAYQNSSIRDVATICDILDMVDFFKGHDLILPSNSLFLFEEVVKNTLQAYHSLYQKEELPDFPDGNIGDIGFFLLALERCCAIFPSGLPQNWKETKSRLIQLLLDRQHADGSMSIFFDHRLNKYEKSSEAFYLPEALIGLISALGTNTKQVDSHIIDVVQKAIAYCSQDKNREQNLSGETATFYANWQFQLLYYWALKKPTDGQAEQEANHLEKLIIALKSSEIPEEPFGPHVATVEIACYLEGLIHAQLTLQILKMPTSAHDEWFKRKINSCLQFLYELQMAKLSTAHGGFVHHLHSHEARIDVAGHVFSALRLIYG